MVADFDPPPSRSMALLDRMIPPGELVLNVSKSGIGEVNLYIEIMILTEIEYTNS